ncbi:MauE/DoxX family redox-associated membrane protein [Aquipuribacter hungaricus]|uniref:MauE/DoxX family redox-associated membrane protein n=1 Tax=Aquipuribacter hungaricus TaxID=545624 RepID=A0ABV7WDM8_9MICO
MRRPAGRAERVGRVVRAGRPSLTLPAVPPAGPAEHRALAGVLLVSGVGHLVRPAPFDSIVPGWLPPSRRFWTVASGVAELVVALLLARPETRRAGGLAAAGLFVAVFPANVWMVWLWRHRRWPWVATAVARLPLQAPLVAWGLRVARAAAPGG